MSRLAVAEAWEEDYRRRYPPRTIEMARLYVEQGLTYTEIAERYGVTRQRVGQLLGPMDLADHQVEQRRALRARGLEHAYRQIVEGDATVEEEAARLGYKNAAVLKHALWAAGTPLPRYEAPHGTLSRYTSSRWRCRCEACMQANRDHQRDRRAAGLEPPTHGVSGYANYGCKCKVCREAWRLHERELRRRRRQRKEAMKEAE